LACAWQRFSTFLVTVCEYTETIWGPLGEFPFFADPALDYLCGHGPHHGGRHLRLAPGFRYQAAGTSGVGSLRGALLLPPCAIPPGRPSSDPIDAVLVNIAPVKLRIFLEI
jgi:hypothetical protein